jgi:hypothetical protein
MPITPVVNVHDVVSPFAYHALRLFGYLLLALAWWVILASFIALLKPSVLRSRPVLRRKRNWTPEPQPMPIPLMARGRVARVLTFPPRSTRGRRNTGLFP